MTVRLLVLTLLIAACAMVVQARAQEEAQNSDDAAATAEGEAPAVDDAPPVADEPAAASDSTVGESKVTAEEPANEVASESPVAAVTGAVDDVAADVDQDPNAQRAKAGVLEPIYALAENFAVPWFHWIAFALMVAGVVSFALQLVLGKLVVLAKGSISFSEILSDGLGLVVSLIGLVLTTQAAAENSTFTASAFQVLSATGAGGLAGFIFYLWGQRQEVQAAAGRRAAAATRDVLPPRK